MEQLGYKLKNNIEALKGEVEAANICFMHAPLFHPSYLDEGPSRSGRI